MSADDKLSPTTRVGAQLGCWVSLERHHHWSGVLQAVHVLPAREVDRHLLDVGGQCSCEPDDDNVDDIHAPPLWVHKELTEIM
jgi:hypothetical protein